MCVYIIDRLKSYPQLVIDLNVPPAWRIYHCSLTPHHPPPPPHQKEKCKGKNSWQEIQFTSDFLEIDANIAAKLMIKSLSELITIH